MADSNKDQVAGYQINKYSGRQVPKEYFNYLIAKWMRSHRHNNHFIMLTDSNAYYKAYDSYLKNILKRPDTLVRLAVLLDDPDVVLGFSVIENETLHYVFVHKDCRLQGIAKKLVPTKISSFTHLTNNGMELWSTKLKDAKFDPFQ